MKVGLTFFFKLVTLQMTMIIRLNPTFGILFTLFSTFSCSEDRRLPSDVIPREKFTQLYVALLVAGERGPLSSPDTTRTWSKKEVVDSILAKYDVTEIQVRYTVQEYSKDLQLWKEFYDGAINRMEQMRREEQTKKRP